MNKITTFIKKLAAGIVKRSFYGSIIILIPVSILLSLEYASPKIDLFPLFTVSIVSFFWIFLLAVHFVWAQPKDASARRRWQPFGDLADRVRNSARAFSGKFSRASSRNNFSDPFRSFETSIGEASQPVGILLIIEKKQAAKPSVATASTSNR